MAATLKLPVGIEDFKEIRQQGFYYIDKTRLIEQLLDSWGKVNLFTRPRRFGKTLNMSMLRNFFTIGTDQTLQNRLCHRLAFGMMSLCKNYLKDRSAGRAGMNGYSAVMYAHDFMNQGQPKAYSAKLAASGFIYAEEWFKYAFF